MIRTARSLSVITLAYNEEGNLERVVRHALAALKDAVPDLEILIVDDGSTDRTGEIADRLATEIESVRALHHERNRGIGAGMETGHRNARGDLISYAVGDGQIPPSSILSFLEVIESTDVALGMYRTRADSWKRKFLSFVWRDLLTRLLFGRVPMPDGNYMFRRELVEDVRLVTTTGVSSIELLYKLRRKGCRFTEVPIDTLPRMTGESKVANWRYILNTMREMIKLRFALAHKS